MSEYGALENLDSKTRDHRSLIDTEMTRFRIAFFTVLAPLVPLVLAQECFQYGSPQSGSSDACLCPAGFNPPSGGNGTCSLPVCGGSLYEPGEAAPGGSGGLGDVSSGCGCTGGWGGPSCTGRCPLWGRCKRMRELSLKQSSVPDGRRVHSVAEPIPQFVQCARHTRTRHDHDVLGLTVRLLVLASVMLGPAIYCPGALSWRDDLDHHAHAQCVAHTRWRRDAHSGRSAGRRRDSICATMAGRDRAVLLSCIGVRAEYGRRERIDLGLPITQLHLPPGSGLLRWGPGKLAILSSEDFG